jgi:hypothetical protein
MHEVPLNQLSVALAVLTATLIILLPRRMAMMPLLAGVCFLPIGQSLQIAGLHFYLFRLVLLASLTRVLIRGEAISTRWCLLDALVFCWITARLGIGSLSHPGWALFIERGGYAFDCLISYIVARSLLKDRNDLLLHIRYLAIVMIPLAAAMIAERATGRNVFAVLGGVSEISQIREGVVRAQGAFRSSIFAGTLGATVLPLMIALIRMRNLYLRWSGVVGSVCAALIVWLAASSGPLMSAFSAVAALCLWRLRHSLRLVHVGLLLILLMAQAGMNRPVWWIFDTVSRFTGGGGWHRSFIIDAAIRHWDEWLLVGISQTIQWGGPALSVDPYNIDITNEYVAQGVEGGILTLCLFLAILWTCFKRLGPAWRAKRGSIDSETEWLAWCTGVALFAHCISFFSISYFDQSIFYLFWLLSAIAAGTMERSWLICDRSVRSVPRATNRQQTGGVSGGGGGHAGVKLPGVIRGVHWTERGGQPTRKDVERGERGGGAVTLRSAPHP